MLETEEHYVDGLVEGPKRRWTGPDTERWASEELNYRAGVPHGIQEYERDGALRARSCLRGERTLVESHRGGSLVRVDEQLPDGSVCHWTVGDDAYVRTAEGALLTAGTRDGDKALGACEAWTHFPR